MPICRQCRQKIPPADVNPAADVAYCRRCNLAMRLSEIISDSSALGSFDPARPPRGVHVEGGASGLVLRASHRSWLEALGLLLMSLVWNSIVLSFVVFALNVSLQRMGVPLPEWWPAPANREGLAFPLGVIIFLWIFLLPFIVVGVALVGRAVFHLAGGTTVRLRPGLGEIFTGIEPLGRTWRFDPCDVAEVKIRERAKNSATILEGLLSLADGSEIPFGGSLPRERLRYLAAGIRSVCASLKC